MQVRTVHTPGYATCNRPITVQLANDFKSTVSQRAPKQGGKIKQVFLGEMLIKYCRHSLQDGKRNPIPTAVKTSNRRRVND